MGEIADMILEGILDEETGEYIGDMNEEIYGSSSPGFPVSYNKRKSNKTNCHICGKSVKIEGLGNHLKDKHGTLIKTDLINNVTTRNGHPICRPNKTNCPICRKLVKIRGLQDHMEIVHGIEPTPKQ